MTVIHFERSLHYMHNGQYLKPEYPYFSIRDMYRIKLFSWELILEAKKIFTVLRPLKVQNKEYICS